MAAPGKFKTYDNLSNYMGNGIAIDFDSIAIKYALYLSTSNANTLAVGTGILGDLTNELAAANGYATGGVSVAGVSWTKVGSVWTLNATSPIALGTPTPGTWTARFGVLYFNATITGIVKPLIAVHLLDSANADVVFPIGNPAELRLNAGGILTLTGATTD